MTTPTAAPSKRVFASLTLSDLLGEGQINLICRIAAEELTTPKAILREAVNAYCDKPENWEGSV